MLVMTLTECPPALRGELTRWLLEIRPHVYVGNVNARVRDRLWEKACARLFGGSVLQIWNSPTEQGFAMRSFGAPDYWLRDFEGLILVERPVNVEATAPTDSAAGGNSPPDVAHQD